MKRIDRLLLKSRPKAPDRHFISRKRVREIERLIRFRYGLIPNTDDADHTVDDVALYSTALTSADVLQHYQAGVGGGTGQPPSSPTRR